MVLAMVISKDLLANYATALINNPSACPSRKSAAERVLLT
jgi:hypothetical protein